MNYFMAHEKSWAFFVGKGEWGEGKRKIGSHFIRKNKRNFGEFVFIIRCFSFEKITAEVKSGSQFQ